MHLSSREKDIFIFSTARGGSTWLMELIASQPNFKFYDEPLNIRRENVIRTKLFSDWEELMPDGNNDKKIFRYLENLKKNKYPYMNPTPFRKNHRFITRRIVFKIHEIEYLINLIKDYFGSIIVYLIRHPIATTISRVTLPRLAFFTESEFYRLNCLSSAQHTYAKKLFKTGTEFEKGILSWCYQNLYPLKCLDRKDWLFLTYEELVLNPVKTCQLISKKCRLPNLDKMIKQVHKPSSNIKMSNPETIKIHSVRNIQSRKISIVKKWRNFVSLEQIERANEILYNFDNDVYSKGQFIANEKYLNFSDTISILNSS